MNNLKFYHDEPSIMDGLFYTLFGGWAKHRRSLKISRILRRVYENAGLVKKEEHEEGAVITYPYTEIKEDAYNLYFNFHMIPGQTSAEWERKIDAFSHALSSDMVRFQVKRGVVELTLQHAAMNVTEVLYKQNADHDLNIGYYPGGVLSWNFDRVPHALIVGMTGTGKSTFVRNLLVQFRKDWTLRVVDGKYIEFDFMRELGYDVATTASEFVTYIDDAQDEVNKRFRELQKAKRNNYNDLNMKPYFLLCDEFIFLAESVSSKKEKGEAESERDKLFGKLRDISLRGRAAGVFLILILQRPDSTFMPTVVRDNLMCKIVLGGSETALEMALGSEYKRLENLGPGQGYCLIDEVVSFTFPNYDMSQFVSDMGLPEDLQEEPVRGKVVNILDRKAVPKETNIKVSQVRN